jgi:hypothetical protein
MMMVMKVHVLPREMLGKSTFGLSMWLLKWLPIRLVDRFLLIVSWLMLGDTARFGLDRPRLGPLQLKNLSGKTPVLDVGTLAKIKSGDIKVLTFYQINIYIYMYMYIFFFSFIDFTLISQIIALLFAFSSRRAAFLFFNE